MIVKFTKSVGYAMNGIKLGLAERNMKIHVLAGVIVIALGWYFHVTQTEWLILILCIGMVITAELGNTALEKIADALVHQNPDMHRLMGEPKDLGAGAVLVISLAAAVVGCLIFLPHVWLLVSSW